MATATVPETSDTRAASDWREGVIDRGPDHVYAKTALSQQEWRHRAHEADRNGLRFVVVSHQRGFNFVSTAKLWAAAQADLATVIRLAPGSFAPAGRLSVRVVELSEWERIQRERQP